MVLDLSLTLPLLKAGRKKNFNVKIDKKSYRKVCVTNKQKDTKLSMLFKRKISLKDKLKSCDESKEELE